MRPANATPEPKPEGIPGVTYREEAAGGSRLFLQFAAFPPAEVRRIVLRHGFKWSPAAKAWYRPLTHNGRRAARAALTEIAQHQKEEQTPR